MSATSVSAAAAAAKAEEVERLQRQLLHRQQIQFRDRLRHLHVEDMRAKAAAAEEVVTSGPPLSPPSPVSRPFVLDARNPPRLPNEVPGEQQILQLKRQQQQLAMLQHHRQQQQQLQQKQASSPFPPKLGRHSPSEPGIVPPPSPPPPAQLMPAAQRPPPPYMQPLPQHLKYNWQERDFVPVFQGFSPKTPPSPPPLPPPSTASVAASQQQSPSPEYKQQQQQPRTKRSSFPTSVIPGTTPPEKRKECDVCGDDSDSRQHLNYGANVCFSCRAFFRRAHQQSAR